MFLVAVDGLPDNLQQLMLQAGTIPVSNISNNRF